MRVAHKYIETHEREGSGAAVPVPRTAAEFRARLAYDPLTAEGLLALTQVPWVAELHQVLRELLKRDRSVLSVGSGQGEHELPFFLDGYDITASDLLEDPLDDARREFPGFMTMSFDILEPTADRSWDDVLITGLDYALDDAQMRTALGNARELLTPGGRVILVARACSTPAIHLIDSVLVPAWMGSRRLRHALRRDGTHVVRVQHAYRRSRRELRTLAAECGLGVLSTRYAMFGVELERIPLPAGVLRPLRRADRTLHALNSATIFELQAQPA